MKILKNNAKGMTRAQIAQAHAAARVSIAQARAYEKSDGTVQIDIPELMHEAMNECPCADDLTNKPEYETDDTSVWECPHCTCHHYTRKE